MMPLVSRSSHAETDDLRSAVAFARSHATAGLETFPFDTVFRATIDQLDAMDAEFAAKGGLDDFEGTGVDLGLMPAKELGNDEQDFAHALCVIQSHLDSAAA